ncbi:Killer cell lectin-like receptor subfamily B member 1 [Tupaia chinensis]|uniref:Killer cell lectin-like receptor subfamily B member 1 n=1 Tax=Tupaia chinensis TaxID=246437 RepID=L9L9A2_TUPCH|nr:Killer cell lectin-like receptor subfamily B member 1 [Tupaia chinensis]
MAGDVVYADIKIAKASVEHSPPPHRSVSWNSSTTHKSCPSGDWKLFGGKCYWISESMQSWTKSQRDCAMKNSNLMIIQDFIDMVQSECLNNLRRKVTNNCKCGWVGTQRQHSISEGTLPLLTLPFTTGALSLYTRLVPILPPAMDRPVIYADLNLFRNSGPESSSPRSLPREKPSQFKCPMNWQQVREKCLIFETNVSSWNNSRTDCSRKDSTLLLIQDQEELKLIQNKISDVGILYWIGLRFTEKNWKWINDSFLHSNTIQVFGDADENSCAYISKTELTSEDCGAENKWICQIKK